MYVGKWRGIKGSKRLMRAKEVRVEVKVDTVERIVKW